MAHIEKPIKFEHVLRQWEIKYGYLGFKADEDWRSFFSPVLDKHFDVTVFGNKIFARKVDEHGRIYLGPAIMKDLKPGDIVVCSRDEKGNYSVERKK
jgi:hypothetical protein